MPSFEITRQVKHSQDKMFSLVSDVEKYPDFVPFCKKLLILSKSYERGKEQLVTDMTVGSFGLEETFRSYVVLDKSSYRVSASASDRPFQNLLNVWQFDSLPSGCLIHFFIEYEFKNRMFEILFSRMFNHAFSLFTDAFEKHADKTESF